VNVRRSVTRLSQSLCRDARRCRRQAFNGRQRMVSGTSAPVVTNNTRANAIGLPDPQVVGVAREGASCGK